MVKKIILAGFEKLIYFAFQVHIIFFWINYILNLQFFVSNRASEVIHNDVFFFLFSALLYMNIKKQ